MLAGLPGAAMSSLPVVMEPAWEPLLCKVHQNVLKLAVCTLPSHAFCLLCSPPASSPDGGMSDLSMFLVLLPVFEAQLLLPSPCHAGLPLSAGFVGTCWGTHSGVRLQLTASRLT